MFSVFVFSTLPLCPGLLLHELIVCFFGVAAHTTSLCFILPYVAEDVFGRQADVPARMLLLREFGISFIELLALHYSSVLDRADLDRVSDLCNHLQSRLDSVCFVSAPEKPKWHYVLAHSQLMMTRCASIDLLACMVLMCFVCLFVMYVKAWSSTVPLLFRV